MNIAALNLYSVDLPITGAGYQLSRGRLVTKTRSIVVEIVTDTGLVGWGESCPFGSNYLPGFAGGALEALRELGAHLIGQNPLEVEGINQTMDSVMSGHPYAKSAIDIACWDLLGKATGLPLYTLLGGLMTPDPLVRTSINAAEGPDLAAIVKAKRDKGFRVLTLKVGDDAVADAELTRDVAAARQPGDRLIVDANGGWPLHEAITFVQMIADVPGILIEAPCMSLSDCLSLAEKTTHPVVLDECLEDLETLATVLVRHKISTFNLKIERVGGITKARKMRDLIVALGGSMFIQEVGGAEISWSATTHMAHTVPQANLLGATTLKVTKSMADGAPVLTDGCIRANDRPGLGLDIIRDCLGETVAPYRLYFGAGDSAAIDRNERARKRAVRHAAGGPVDVALDVVGGRMFMPMINALRRGGRRSSSDGPKA